MSSGTLKVCQGEGKEQAMGRRGKSEIKCPILVNFMNISPQQQGSAQGYSPLFHGEATPYLSPLFGSASHWHPSSQENFTQFRLEDEGVSQMVVPELPSASEQDDNELLFSLREVVEEIEPIKLLPEPEKTEIMTPAFVPRTNSSPIFAIVCFLVEQDDLPEHTALALGKPLYESCQKYESIFKVLLAKFKKLRKTKEQMVKFCMRKAFKYSSDCKKTSRGSRSRKNSEKNFLQKSNSAMEMPFRKNSSQKTMNSQFLRQVFSNPDFVTDYSKFLGQLQGIIEEDNNTKIEYLSDSIQKMFAKGELDQLQNIKRLPWTKTILRKTGSLAKSLLVDFGPGSEEQGSHEQN